MPLLSKEFFFGKKHDLSNAFDRKYWLCPFMNLGGGIKKQAQSDWGASGLPTPIINLIDWIESKCQYNESIATAIADTKQILDKYFG